MIATSNQLNIVDICYVNKKCRNIRYRYIGGASLKRISVNERVLHQCAAARVSPC